MTIDLVVKEPPLPGIGDFLETHTLEATPFEAAIELEFYIKKDEENQSFRLSV